MGRMTIRDIDWKGKKALVRVDFNVPFESTSANISDDTRIRECIPTLDYLLRNGASLILCGHLGRPGGVPQKDLQLSPIAKRFAEHLGRPVKYVHDAVGEIAVNECAVMAVGDVILLENIRFYPEEEENSESFSQSLANLADIFVNDAFGTAHRAHSSTEGVAHCLPAVAGLLMEKELEFLGHILSDPAPPVAAIFGGAKMSDKVAILNRLVQQTQLILVGGGMAATFLKSQGIGVGASKTEDSLLDFCSDIFHRVGQSQGSIAIPVDVVVSNSIEPDSVAEVVSIHNVPADAMILDIGPETASSYSTALEPMNTIVWNGPMGVFELPQFRQGTEILADALARSSAVTVVGGGSTSEAVTSLGFADKISHVSTGGGASLEFMEGKILPGIAALDDAAESKR